MHISWFTLTILAIFTIGTQSRMGARMEEERLALANKAKQEFYEAKNTYNALVRSGAPAHEIIAAHSKMMSKDVVTAQAVLIKNTDGKEIAMPLGSKFRGATTSSGAETSSEDAKKTP